MESGGPVRRVLVLLNEKAGTLARAGEPREEADRIGRLFADAGVEAEVRLVPGPELAETAKAAAAGGGVDAIVAGGGDGTLNTIANAIAGSPTAFAVLPLGTFNHFAKELNVPADLEPAVAALARGTVETVPVGEVNGTIFLNFSALGLHPEMVRHRDAQRKALGRGKMWAMVVASVRVLVRFPLMWVRLAVTGKDGRSVPFTRVTPSVIVGNNAHQMRVFGLEGGDYEDRAVLNVFVARARGRWGVIWLTLRAMFGALERAEKFEALSVRQLVLDNYRSHVRVSIDGEVADLRPPLEYRLRPGGLKVLVPAVSDEAEEAPPAPPETHGAGSS